MEHFDVIVVGAGLAGLTAGAKLAKEGKKVLLVEQHSKMGGCATRFRRKNTTFEIGLHEMDSAMEEPKKAIFQDLGVYDNIEFIQVPEFFRITNRRIDVVVPHGIENAIQALTNAFSNENEVIQTFFQDISAIYHYVIRGNMEELAKYGPLTLGEYLDTLTKNEDMKLVLTGNLGYYGDDPYAISIIYFAVAQYSYFNGGGWFIKGGSQVLSDYLASFIEEYGGTIIRRHLVTEILVENETVIGIKYKRKLKKQETEPIEIQEQEAFGQIILANAAIPNVVNELIPSLNGTEYQQEVNSFEINCSLFNIYLIFSEKPQNNYYSTFIFSDMLTLKDFTAIEKSNDFTQKGFVFADYNTFDSQLNEEGKFVGVICGIDYLKNWTDLSEDEYITKKEEVAEILIERLNAVIPGIKDIIIHREVATPKTIVRYTLNPKGCVYGFSQTPTQLGPFRKSIRNPPINNLYFASAWTNSGGFSGAIQGGYSCARKILKDHP